MRLAQKRASAKRVREADLDVAREKERVRRARRDPEKRRQEQARFRAANPDYWRHYAASNRDARRATGRRWRSANPDLAREATRRWRAANWDKVLASLQRRRALRAGAVGTFTVEQARARFDAYGGRCWMCGAAAEVLDHVIALCNGGSNWPSNLRPACVTCNGRKGQWEMTGPRSIAEILSLKIKYRDYA